MDQSKVAHCIETLCQKGCREVACTILALEQNEPVEEFLHLSEGERLAVLNELKSIMAVYGGNFCGPA